MPNYVDAIGPRKCTMALIGEAPGSEEDKYGQPFVGSSGDVLNKRLHSAGLSRQECYITNLVKERPYNNDFEIFWNKSTPTPELLEWRQRLLEELCNVETNVFVPLGGQALWALTGERLISNYRGTIMSTTLPNGKVIKVIPTYHPAAVLRQWKLGNIITADLRKAKDQSSFPEVIYPKRELVTAPTFSDLLVYADRLSQPDIKNIAYDIETSPGGIKCISLSHSTDYAMSIPTTTFYWGKFQQLREVISLLDMLLRQSTASKITQNGAFDMQYLIRAFSILPSKPWEDTMIAQYNCYLDFAGSEEIEGKKKKGSLLKTKSLAFLSSVYTDEPYYKDMLKKWTEAGGTDDELLWKYNAKDAAVTLEVWQNQQKELDYWGVRDIYRFDMDFMEVVLYMMVKGVKVDVAKKQEHIKDLQHRVDVMIKGFEDKFGKVNIRSPKQVKELLSRLGIKCPTIRRKETTNAKAIEKLAKISPEFRVISDIRACQTLLSNHLSAPEDTDGRWHCNFNQARTNTGRLSSDTGLFGSATNLQNVKKSIRDIIIADDGKELTSFDLAGADAMIVAFLAEDPVLMDIFTGGGKYGNNVHNYTAKLIWGDLTDELIKEDREMHKKKGTDTQSYYYKAKKVRHSGHYWGTWVTLSEQLGISAAEAKVLLSRFYASSPNILRWHAEVREQLWDTRTLVTPMGRKRKFFDRFNDDMVRQGLAFIPQSTVADIINKGLMKLYSEYCSKYEDLDILLQVHDEGVIQHLPENREAVHRALLDVMQIPITIKRRTFTIPIEIKVGKNWKFMEECKYEKVPELA